MNEEKKTHPSYVMVGFTRVNSSNGVGFFGSKIKSNSFITLSIKRAEVARRHAHDYIHAREILMELRLSPNQFAELLTSMNCGDGVPGTLELFNHERVEEPPYESELNQFKQEIAESEPKIEDLLVELERAIDESKLSKRDTERIKRIIIGLRNALTGYIPFIIKTAYNSLEKAVVEAKGAVDSFYTGLLMRLGVKTLKESATVELIEGSQDDK